MYERPRRILVATDGSPSASAALELVCSLHLAPNDRVDVVSVVTATPLALAGPFTEPSYAYDAAAEIAQLAAARLARCGVRAESRVADGPVVDAIVQTARAIGADLIVVGSRGHGMILGALLGSTARTVARMSPIPVLVVRDRRAAPVRVLLAVDGSPDSRAAADALCAIPLPPDAEVVVVHVVPDDRRDSTRSLDLLRLVASRLRAPCTPRVEVVRGDVADAIVARAAALGSDLVVLGAGGAHTRLLQGSTADRVLRGTHCSVLVARAAERVRSERPVHTEATLAG